MQIMVIDNNPANLAQLAAQLRKRYPCGRISAFTDPLLAVKHGFNHPVDLLFARSEMRGLNGREAARLLSGVHPGLSVRLLGPNGSL